MTCTGLHVDDLVTYTGTGQHVLQAGPGRVVQLEGDSARVEVRVSTKVCGQPVFAGERFLFPARMLRRVVPKGGAAE